MKVVDVWQMHAHERYRIVQHFAGGTTVVTEGKAMSAPQMEYVYIVGAGRINLHPYVGMPNIEIYEFEEGD